MTEIKWKHDMPNTPPRTRRRQYTWFFDELRNRPGMWAEFPNQNLGMNPGALAGNLRRGSYLDAPPYMIEVRVVDGIVYVRWRNE